MTIQKFRVLKNYKALLKVQFCVSGKYSFNFTKDTFNYVINS